MREENLGTGSSSSRMRHVSSRHSRVAVSSPDARSIRSSIPVRPKCFFFLLEIRSNQTCYIQSISIHNHNSSTAIAITLIPTLLLVITIQIDCLVMWWNIPLHRPPTWTQTSTIIPIRRIRLPLLLRTFKSHLCRL